MHKTLTLLILLGLILLRASALMAGPPCAPLVLTAITIQEETTGFSVDAEYPVLCRSEANRTVRDWVSNRLFDLKKLDPGHDLTDFRHKYEMRMRYAVWPTPNHRYASLKLNVSVYSGGAHANHWPMTWVFDMTDGHNLTLQQLLPDTNAALEAIAILCREILPSALGDMYVPEMLEAGTEPFFENFDRFILTSEGVAFFFPPYQVGPFAAGEQIVTIPYERLSKFLAPEIKQKAGVL